MSDDRPSDVLGALPRRRPQRRSDKRAAPAPADNSSAQQAAAPAGPRSAAAPKRASASTKQGSGSGKRTAARTRGATSKASAASTKPGRRKQPVPAAPIRAADDTAHPVAPPTRATRRRPDRLPQPAQPPGVPPTPAAPRPEATQGQHVLGTAAQAAAELAEIGLTVSTRALRNAVARLPRP
ncbi:MAG: hypothetical protein ACLP4R_28550 [Solirubrobacteraceae bacterium]